MANWTGVARSNYFFVKDMEEFASYIEELGVESCSDDTGRVAFLCEDGLPARFDEADMAQFLQDGEICVVMEAGFEKMRYVSGYATAINWKGASVSISLQDIYEKAIEKLDGVKPTKAEY